jgi:hypothetical protein
MLILQIIFPKLLTLLNLLLFLVWKGNNNVQNGTGLWTLSIIVYWSSWHGQTVQHFNYLCFTFHFIFFYMPLIQNVSTYNISLFSLPVILNDAINYTQWNIGWWKQETEIAKPSFYSCWIWFFSAYHCPFLIFCSLIFPKGKL